MIRTVIAYPEKHHILIVEDNSPDGTADIVKKLQEEFSDRLFIEEREGKLGLGTAYIHGFNWALKNNYQFIFEMDADFSHDPDKLAELLKACRDNGADVTVGSRYCKGGKVKDWPLNRILMSYFASVYVRMILWVNIKDTTAGYKCYKRKVLENINFDQIHFKGYAFQICMKYAAVKKGFQVKEVPITFIDRVKGQSKMSMGIFKEAFFGVWKMRNMKF